MIGCSWGALLFAFLTSFIRLALALGGSRLGGSSASFRFRKLRILFILALCTFKRILNFLEFSCKELSHVDAHARAVVPLLTGVAAHHLCSLRLLARAVKDIGIEVDWPQIQVGWECHICLKATGLISRSHLAGLRIRRLWLSSSFLGRLLLSLLAAYLAGVTLV